MFTKAYAPNRSMTFAAWTISVMIGLPIPALCQTYEKTRTFCKISQMLIPIFLDGGNISGKSVFKAGGG